MIEPFEASRLKIARAKRHLQELTDEVSAYFERKPPIMRNEMSTLVPWYKNHAWVVRIREAVPPELSAIIGDVIHNQRSSLDLLACDLVRLAAPKSSLKEVHFPFCAHEADLDRSIKDKKINRAGPDVVRLIKGLRPFRGGNLALKAIHDLDCQDKHSALIPVASGGVSPALDVRFHPNGGVTPIPSIPSKIDRDGQAFLHTIPIPGLHLGAEIPAAFHLTFGVDGSPFAGHEIIKTLGVFMKTVEDVLDMFVTRHNEAVAPGAPLSP